MNPSRKRRNPWPYAIITYFVIFASALAAWIAYAFRQNMDLVSKDYYQEEVLYQQQLDRVNRTRLLGDEVRVTHDASQRAILITVPAAHARQYVTGRVHLYRPSDAKLDRSVPLSVDSRGHQRIDAQELRAGLWKVRVEWTADGREYFFDQPVVVAGL